MSNKQSKTKTTTSQTPSQTSSPIIKKYETNISHTITITRKEYLLRLREYVKQMTQFIMTARFTDTTWEENQEYRKTLKNMKCIYCSPVEVARKIPCGALMYVIEMNNERNQIMGIGLIKNTLLSKSHQVYSDFNYNRYCYGGTLYISREDLRKEEIPIVEFIEMLCFKGKTHMKRNHGISTFSYSLLFKTSSTINLHEELRKMFKSRMQTDTKS